eukprot:m.6789 g.6789  ORF g.6789 m.6789 type:complete len:291 (+) comp2653_c1_seq1:82-954(+)
MSYRERIPGCSLYVGNLAWSTRWQGLKDHFAQIGPVAYADVMVHGYGQSRGFGVVRFDSPELAQQAIDELNGSTLDGREIEVRHDNHEGKTSRPPRSFQQQQPQQPPSHITRAYEGDKGTTIFVDNLPFRIHWRDLKSHFATVGNVVTADLFQDRQGLSKGRGVVRFDTQEAAEEAVTRFNDTEFGGRTITVRIDQEADKFRDGVSVHVSNLPYSVSWRELKDLFRPMGDLMHAEVVMRNGRSQGWGLVRFTNMDDAQNAIDSLDGHSMGDRQISVRLDKGRQERHQEEE